MWYINIIIGILLKMMIEYEFKDYIAGVKEEGVKGIMTNPVKKVPTNGIPTVVALLTVFGNDLAVKLQEQMGVANPVALDWWQLLIIFALACVYALTATIQKTFGISGAQKVLMDAVVTGVATDVAQNMQANSPVSQADIQAQTPAAENTASPASPLSQPVLEVFVDENGNEVNAIRQTVGTAEAQ